MMATTVLLGARAAACGTSDDERKAGPPGADLDGAVGDDASVVDGQLPDPSEGGPTPPPSYCQGIVFYASFDQGIAPEVGEALVRPVAGVGAATGHFGGAVALGGIDGGSPADGGAMVYYDTPDGGTSFYPQQEGTIAFWFHQVASARPLAALVRPLTSLGTLLPAGPAVAREAPAPGFGLYENLGDQPIVTMTDRERAPYVRQGDFNHYVTAWRRAVDGGPPPIALIAVNGGTGDVLADGGADAGTDEDAGTDDAGNVRLPYFKRRVNARFPSYGPPRSVRIGGNTTTTPHGQHG